MDPATAVTTAVTGATASGSNSSSTAPLSASAAAAEHLLTAYQLLLGRLGESHPATSAAAFALGQHLAAAAAATTAAPAALQQKQRSAAEAWLRKALQGYSSACAVVVGGEQGEGQEEGAESRVTCQSAGIAKGTLAVAQAAVALARVLLAGRTSSSSNNTDSDSGATGKMQCSDNCFYACI
jgi:hypothetical protein